MFGVYAQDAAGDYQLNGTNVRYTSLYRGTEPAPVMISDTYGMGITFPALTFNTGDAMNQLINGPYPRNVLAAIGVNLNVSLYDDGSGYIYEGSTYPTAITVDCVTFPSVLPVTDQLGYTSNLDVSTSGVSAQTMSIVGQASLGPYAGQPIGSFGLQASDVFDFFPATPADAGMGAGLYGPAAGYMQQPHNTPFLPQFNNGDWITDPSQLVPTGGYEEPGDIYLEWHAVDGAISMSGFGDCLPGDPSCGPADGDEDGDGSPLDRQLGVPYLPVSYPAMGPTGLGLCGSEYDPFGELSPFDFSTLDGVMPIAGGNESLIDGVESGCFDTVEGLVEAQCDAYGGPVQAVAGLCFDTSQGDEFYGGCMAAGVAASVEAACLQLGFDAESCAGGGAMAAGALAAACAAGADFAQGAVAQANGTCEYYGGLWNTIYGGCMAQVGDSATCMAQADAAVAGYGDCATWASVTYGNATCAELGMNDCDALTSELFADGLCTLLATNFTTSTTCDEWAGSFEDDFLNDLAADQNGMSCTEFAGTWGSVCLDGEGTGNSFYVINPAFAGYGMYVTFNGVAASQCMPTCIATYMGMGMDEATATGTCATTPGAAGCADYMANDSDHDFNGTDGRLVMGYSPQCFAEIQVREVYVDFTELGEGECYADNPYTPGIDEGAGSGTGDIDNSCAGGGTDTDQSCLPNVADVVLMVQVILGNNTLTDQETCRGDINGDSIINVVDVVQTVAIILGGNKTNFAEEIDIIKSNNGLRIVSEAPVGAVQITLSHGDDFSISLTEDAMVAEYATKGNQTTIIIVMPESDGLFTAEGQYEIVEVIAANDENLISVNVIEPSEFSLSKAYPNPFNPTTSMLLNMEFDGQVDVKVYNVNGQLVDVIADRQFKAGMHTVSWNAQEFASGMYFIKANIGSEVITQKVSLMK